MHGVCLGSASALRLLRRYVQHTVETLIARKILSGQLNPGEELLVDVEDGQLIVK